MPVEDRLCCKRLSFLAILGLVIGSYPALAQSAVPGAVLTRTIPAPPAGGGPFATGEVPGFRVWVRITGTTGEMSPVQQEADCLPEALCVSGAVPGRTEALLRIVGPKPNGYLWPTVIRLTTSRVEIWVEQEATGAMRYYVLEEARPGHDTLPGLFDRHGFLRPDGTSTARLDDLVMNVLDEDAVLHGWGQAWSRYATRGAEYFEDVGAPALVSDYVSLERVRQDPTQLARPLEEMSSWTDSNGVRYEFVVMECVTHPLTVDDLIAAVRAAGIDIPDFDTDEELRAYLTGILSDPSTRALVRQHIVFRDEQVAAGEWDEEIAEVGRAIGQVEGPVLLRFMQEFVGGVHSDDVKGPDTFKQAWRRFVDIVRANGGTNAELVWHPNRGTRDELETWWPGDEYVDWVATSVFRDDGYAEKRIHNQFATDHGKPFVIAESAPTLGDFSEAGIETAGVWDSWFVPFFDFVSDPNVKAFFYINLNWSEDSRFPWPDSRLQSNPMVLEQYRRELADPKYIGSQELSGLAARGS